MTSSRRVLVAGAGGGLGKTLLARLGKGFDVVALPHAELDVSKRNDVVKAVREAKPEIVFDAAGYTDIDGCETDRWQAYLVNRDGAEHLARASAEAGALFVYVSSDLVFDGQREVPYKEEEPPNPLSIYGDTKLAAELAVMSHAPRHLILRTGWFFGPHGRSYVNELVEWRETEEIVFGWEDQKCQPTYLPDFVDAVLGLVEKGQTGVWNVANDGAATHFDVAREAYAILGATGIDVKPLRRGQGGRTALRPKYSVLDCTKLRGMGIRLRSWKEALRAHFAC
jgi:dTDP-4-dehydrorhamnose reductase